MSYCAAVNCNNKVGDPGKTFHSFPVWNPTLFRKWISKVKRSDDGCELQSASLLCSDHFEESCFDKIGDIKHIRADAIPTIFCIDDIPKDKNSNPSSVNPQITTVITSAKLFKSPIKNGTDSLSEFHQTIEEIYQKEKAEKMKLILHILFAFKRFSVNQQKIKILFNRSRILRRKMMQTAMIMVLMAQDQVKIKS